MKNTIVTAVVSFILIFSLVYLVYSSVKRSERNAIETKHKETHSGTEVIKQDSLKAKSQSDNY